MAATAAVAVSVAFWYGAGAPVSLTAMTAAGVAAALALLSGSVLVAAVPAVNRFMLRTAQLHSANFAGWQGRNRWQWAAGAVRPEDVPR